MRMWTRLIATSAAVVIACGSATVMGQSALPASGSKQGIGQSGATGNFEWRGASARSPRSSGVRAGTNQPPDQPTLLMPSNGAQGVGASPTLEVQVTDPESDSMDVTFFGRQVDGGPMQPFTMIALPDTQFYSCGANCAQNGDPATFHAQTQWALDNLNIRDIAFVTLLGDCVQNGDNGGNPVEWLVASSAFAIIEDPITTQLVDGIPFGIAVGNHDQSPTGNADGSTTFYNQFFGEAHFAGRAYYGGHYGSNNDNHYQLFSGGGIDFIIVHLEYDTSPDAPVLAWANDLLQTHSNRKAIVVSHYLLNADGSFGAQGQATYDALKGNDNLFLMLCGHIHAEARRSDVFNGNEVHTLLSDYQSRANGGDGWLRILTFNPQDNTIDVQTYSPTLDQFEVDASSQFTLTFSGGGFVPEHAELGGATGVASGASTSVVWSSLRSLPANETFEWYVEVSDSTGTTTSPVWSFTTACSQDEDCEDGNPCTNASCDTNGMCQYVNTNGVCDDDNPCTDDACDDGACAFTPNSNACDDGDPCTESDVCSGGACVGDAVECSGGEICAPDTGVCVAPVTVTFQQGVSGYTGTRDTFLQSDAPTANNAAATNLIVDRVPEQHILMRFDNIFGEGAGQIPPRATVLSASLTINVTNESAGVGASLHRMLQTWNDTDNWNTWGSGIQNNGVEAAVTADVSSSSGTGSHTINVAPSLAVWAADPASNLGWAWLPPVADNSWQFSSSETGTAANRPRLEVTYIPETCNDHGDCDDGNPCTDDVCDDGLCTYPGNSASCDDGDPCTEFDACSGGTCNGSPVVCPGTEVCAPDTGICIEPETVTFRQGVNGYAGTVDTYLQSNAATANNAASTTLTVDLSPLQQVLMRFDDIFGEDAGRIPAGATILSADLTINVTNESAGVGASLHRMLQTWNDTDNWNTWGSGIQNDGIEAAVAADVSSSSGTGPHTINVTPSLVAWNASPASNFGWAWLPPGADNGWVFNSAETGTVGNRPLLTVTYIRATCDDDEDCDDGDLCTTDVCSDGLCEFVPVECPSGEACRPSTGECAVIPATGEVIIAGLQSWNNPGTQDPGEFIELFNTTNRTIPLDNMQIFSRVDTNADGTLNLDWQLAADLTGKSIAPYSFFLIAESGVDAEGPGNGVHDVQTDMDLATGEGGVAERAISIQLSIDGVHMDYVLYGRHDGADSAAVPPGDIPFSGFSPITLVPAGAVWAYLDDGSDQGTAWSEHGFDDSSWATGPAELGYGDGGEATVVNCGACACPCNPKYVTTYFRRSFEVADPDAIGALTLRLVRDDGAVVYLNGVEVVRTNMPGGTITFTTLANVTVGGADESTFFEFPIDPTQLLPGTNVLAVEIHQDSVTSSDISFNLELLGTPIRTEVCRNTRGASSYIDGLLRRESAEDLYAGYDVPGFYADEDALGDGFPNGVWTSPHDETFGAYEARNSTSAQVLPPGIECLDDLGCDDANDCTLDMCNTSGICEYSNVEGACDDGDFCTEFDVCSSGVCVGSPVDCGMQTCRPADGLCVDCLNDGECGDGDVCNGIEFCDSNGVCQLGETLDCDDGLDCTDDSCDSTNGCQNVDNCPFGEACDAGSGTCELAPLLIAFNDMAAETGDQNAANVTPYDYLVTGGVLKDFDTGLDTPITVTGTTVGGYDANHPTNGGQANPGTDAGDTFGPAGSVIVDLQSSIELDEASWQNILTIDNLDPTRRYTITVTANRDNPAYDNSRYTRVTLLDADTFTNASSPGVVVNSASSVSFSIGYNTVNGYVARWTNVSAADGSVSIMSEWDNGQGSGPDNTKGYAMTALKLEEFVECVDAADCDDGDPCTVDTCTGAACVFEPVDCSAFEDDCNVGVCVSSTGLCEAVPANEGGMCDDGDLCTMSDACSSGMCLGEAVDCSHLDDVCVIGVCNAGSGMCETAPTNEAGLCDDGDDCTSSDACSNGVCLGDFDDCDGDGVCDADDNCPTVPNPGQEDFDSNGLGDACDGLFDFDNDGDVDLVDYAVVADCIGGPGVTVPPGGCSVAAFAAGDADSDDDVDLRDLAELMLEFTGPFVSPCD